MPFPYIYRRMNRKVVVVSVFLCLVAVALSPSVSADSEISVTVDGEDVADGETVEVGASPFVNVTVESDTTLNYVRTGTGSSFSINSVDTSTYRTARNVSVLSEVEFAVEANEVGGETYTHTVVLTRPSDTPRDLQRDVRSIRDSIRSMEDEVNRLEERRNELQQRNENLTQRLNETRQEAENNGSEDGDDGDGGGQGMPGFTVVVALVAVSVAAIAVRHRRD